MAPTCTIIIRCLNEDQYIGRLLDGITRQTVKNIQIIVVDSGSTDQTLAIASKYPTEIVSIDPTDFSFGRSLNLGCKQATGDLIVLASAHVYPVYENWLEKLLAPFQDDQTALVYGKQRGDETSKYSECQLFHQWFPDQSHMDQDHPFCNNANSAIRRSLWQQVAFDETLTGLEDIDWASRVKTLGYKIAYLADAEIIHVHDEQLSQIYHRYCREAMAMKRIFPHDRFGFFEFLRLFLTNVMTDFTHAIQDRHLLRHWGDILTFRLMQFWGTYRGFAQVGPIPAALRQRLYYPKRRHPLVRSKPDGMEIDYNKLTFPREEHLEPTDHRHRAHAPSIAAHTP